MMTNFLKILFSLCITFVLTYFVALSPVFAETPRPVVEKMRNSSSAAIKESNMQVKLENRTDTLKARADREISRRLASLQKLITRIGEFKKLSVSQKASLTTQVQAQINTLTALQAKIKADTDEATLKADVKSIVTSYRIYALFMPQIEILGAADRTLSVSDKMSSQAARLEAKIAEAETKGSNVSDLQTLLADMKAKIADAKTQAQHAIDTVSSLTPEGYPANKTTLQSARAMLKTARQDLLTAQQDARKIIVGLLKFSKITSTITPTVTVSVTATETPAVTVTP